MDSCPSISSIYMFHCGWSDSPSSGSCHHHCPCWCQPDSRSGGVFAMYLYWHSSPSPEVVQNRRDRWSTSTPTTCWWGNTGLSREKGGGENLFLHCNHAPSLTSIAGPSHRIETQGLRLFGVGRNDSGWYQCQADNGLGAVSKSARVRVEGDAHYKFDIIYMVAEHNFFVCVAPCIDKRYILPFCH